MRTTTAHRLPDGSKCVVEELTFRSSLVSREVAGVCVWGQAFSAHDAVAHGLQIAGILDAMRTTPAAYIRWQHCP